MIGKPGIDEAVADRNTYGRLPKTYSKLLQLWIHFNE